MFGKDTKLKLKSKLAGRFYDVEIGKLYEMALDGRITLSGWEVDTLDGFKDILSVNKAECSGIQEIQTEKGSIAVSADSFLFIQERKLAELPLIGILKLRKTAVFEDGKASTALIKRIRKTKETYGFSVSVRDSGTIIVNEIFPAGI